MGFPGTWAMNHTNDNHIQILDDSDPENPQFVTLANQGDMSVSSVKLTNNNTVFDTPFKTYSASSNHPRMMQVQVGSTKGYGLMLSSNGAASSPTPYTISAVPSSVLNVTHSTTHDSTTYTPDDNLAWSTLLNALIEDKSINLLGNKLKQLKYSLTKPVTNMNQKEIDTDDYDSSVGRAYISFGSNTQNKLYLGYNLPYTSNASQFDYAIVDGNADNNISYVLKLVDGKRRWHFANQYRMYTTSIAGSEDSDELLYNCKDIFMRHGILIIHRSDVPGDQTSQYVKAHLVALIDRWAGACTLHSLSENPSISNPNDCGGKLIIRAHYSGSVSTNDTRTEYIQILNRCSTTAFDIIAIGYFGDPYDNVHSAYTNVEPIRQQVESAEYLESPT
jgi:hypothetical protein